MSEPATHPASLEEAALMADVTTRRLRRSGPGGQHRNKVETGIVLTHGPSGVVAEATERRSQHANLRVAVHRLRVNLALQIRRPLDADHYQPSDAWRARCSGARVIVSRQHDDFPSLLAESLDVLATVDFEPRDAASLLQCTPSQLLKLLRQEPRAFGLLNDERAARDLKPLR